MEEKKQFDFNEAVQDLLAGEIYFKNGKAVKGYNYIYEGKKTNMTNAHFSNFAYEYE